MKDENQTQQILKRLNELEEDVSDLIERLGELTDRIEEIEKNQDDAG